MKFSEALEFVDTIKAGHGMVRDGHRQLVRHIWKRQPMAAGDVTRPYLSVVMHSGVEEPWTPCHEDLFADDWDAVNF